MDARFQLAFSVSLPISVGRILLDLALLFLKSLKNFRKKFGQPNWTHHMGSKIKKKIKIKFPPSFFLATFS